VQFNITKAIQVNIIKYTANVIVVAWSSQMT